MDSRYIFGQFLSWIALFEDFVRAKHDLISVPICRCSCHLPPFFGLSRICPFSWAFLFPRRMTTPPEAPSLHLPQFPHPVSLLGSSPTSFQCIEARHSFAATLMFTDPQRYTSVPNEPRFISTLRYGRSGTRRCWRMWWPRRTPSSSSSPRTSSPPPATTPSGPPAPSPTPARARRPFVRRGGAGCPSLPPSHTSSFGLASMLGSFSPPSL